MSIPGYDDWKLMTPEEDYEARGGKICPDCGAWDASECEETSCPLRLEPDPDLIMEQRREDREFEAEHPSDEPF
ncbi:hypothetical protein [Mesorhizobium sp. M2A.F.Ca.ET.039.01.1.1]|uniref:hypothetical protein n=1 Tax=Mesorhizobium sp. M2A.F.Ca.ET.039.01.1.1 TaxID=2496746 RepID=UPI000FCB2666|nr:hypothetical protein [Mesorhizobium sp. M2A.F.Ca.ET.039.01.1.1]RWX72557.1 hypothetical protein EOA24_00775 [Mesorhizobium sp. M2A.F.Ca.ET.039.01.1.1]